MNGNINDNNVKLGGLQINPQDDMAVINTEDDLILSDQEDTLSAIAMDKEFIENLISQTTLKDMKKLFSNRGIILNDEEIDAFIEMIKASSSKKELPDDFFEDASAGVLNNPGMHHLVCSATDIINTSYDVEKISKSVLWI